MSHEDELRSRVNRLADAADIPELTLEDVEHRGRRRVNQQRILAVAAAFLLVVGAVGAVKLLEENGSKGTDVASGDAELGDGDGSAEDTADAETVEVSPTTTIARNQSDYPTAGESYAESDYYGYEQGPSWILPWGDGFLSLAHAFDPSDATLRDLVPDLEDRLGADVFAQLIEAGLNVDVAGPDAFDDFYRRIEIDETHWELADLLWSDPAIGPALDEVMQGGSLRAVFSTSPNGEDWTVVDGFTMPGEQEYSGYVQSDGRRLVVADHGWDTELQESGDITISITEDLQTWQTIALPVTSPDVPAYVQAEVSLGQIVVMDSGVYATTSTWSWIDLWGLLPDDLHDELEENGWGWEPAIDGIRIVDYSAWEQAGEYREEGDATYPTTVPPPPTAYPVIGPDGDEGWSPPVIRVLPWSDFGMTWEDFQSYDGGDTGSSEAWVVGWDGTITTATTPVQSGCCTLVATDAGLLAQSWPQYEDRDFGAEESLWEPPAPLLHFSPDGLTWTEVDGPLETGWYDGIASVDGGVLLVGNRNTNFEYEGRQEQIIWLGAPDGTSWQEITVPGLDAGQYLWFNDSGGAGVAAVVDQAVYEYEDYEYADRPPLAGLHASVETDEYTLVIATDELGAPSVTVTNTDGEIVAQTVQEWAIHWPEEIEEIVFGYGVVSDDGEDFSSLLEEHFEELLMQFYAQAEDLWESVGFEEPVYPEYFPDFLLVATLDGINWLVEDLPDPSGEEPYYYNATPGINGNTVVVSLGDEWMTFSLG